MRLRWSRLIFDREAALVAVDLGLFLSDLLHNGPSRHRIVTRWAVVAVRLRWFLLIFDHEAALVAVDL